MYKCGAQAISPGRETKQIQSDGRVEVKVIQARARLAIQHDLSIFKWDFDHLTGSFRQSKF